MGSNHFNWCMPDWYIHIHSSIIRLSYHTNHTLPISL